MTFFNSVIISATVGMLFANNNNANSTENVNLNFNENGTTNVIAMTNDENFDLKLSNVSDPEFPPNCIHGVFSVSATKKVYFSCGNLQYNTETQKYQFAEHQYDVIGDGGANTGENGIRDLFGWGTWQEGKDPMLSETDDSKYFYDQSKLSTIGAEWTILNKEEWSYLKDRNGGTKIGTARINDMNGLVILPDTWKQPEGVTFKSGFTFEEDDEEAYPKNNKYTPEEWEKMEKAGAVFLPATGWRFGTGLLKYNRYGVYWSSTTIDEQGAYFIYVFSGGFGWYYGNRYYGEPVRLVQVIK